MTDDEMAASRAIDAAFQVQLNDLVNRVTVIVGEHQLRIIEAHNAFDQSLGEIRFHVAEANRRIQDLSAALEMHVGDNGRLTRLLEEATARGRRKGKAEERAKGDNAE